MVSWIRMQWGPPLFFFFLLPQPEHKCFVWGRPGASCRSWWYSQPPSLQLPLSFCLSFFFFSCSLTRAERLTDLCLTPNYHMNAQEWLKKASHFCWPPHSLCWEAADQTKLLQASLHCHPCRGVLLYFKPTIVCHFIKCFHCTGCKQLFQACRVLYAELAGLFFFFFNCLHYFFPLAAEMMMANVLHYSKAKPAGPKSLELKWNFTFSPQRTKKKKSH